MVRVNVPPSGAVKLVGAMVVEKLKSVALVKSAESVLKTESDGE
jgi:hypothetical protein